MYMRVCVCKMVCMRWYSRYVCVSVVHVMVWMLSAPFRFSFTNYELSVASKMPAPTNLIEFAERHVSMRERLRAFLKWYMCIALHKSTVNAVCDTPLYRQRKDLMRERQTDCLKKKKYVACDYSIYSVWCFVMLILSFSLSKFFDFTFCLSLCVLAVLCVLNVEEFQLWK